MQFAGYGKGKRLHESQQMLLKGALLPAPCPVRKCTEPLRGIFAVAEGRRL